MVTIMNAERIASLLQFADGLFPAGGYAHSFGLETYLQSGAVSDPAGVESVVRAQLEGQLASADTVAMLHAMRAAARGDTSACVELDALASAMKPVVELREASCQMGRQTIRIAAAIFDHALIREFAAAVERGTTPGHQSVAFGVVGGVLGWPAQAAAIAFMHSTTVAIVSAAVRLLPMGQLDGQRIIARLAPAIARLARHAMTRDLDGMSSSAVGLEIAAIRHASLEARLFRS